MFNSILGKNKVEIIFIKDILDSPSYWGGNGIIFYVRNGKGVLTYKYGNYKNEALATLVYENIPLIRFHDDEYFCPTCEKLVSAGFGLNMISNNITSTMQTSLNKQFNSLRQSIYDLKPLLSLLPTGYYGLADLELCPTNGNGEFFWKTGNTRTYNKASCPIYGGDSLWSHGRPFYILPTQPPNQFKREQAEFYRKSNSHRAIAYYLDGYLCALLDGHHKAVAAAIEKRLLKSLVIIPTCLAWEKDIKNNRPGGISINGVTLTEDEMITPVKDVLDSWASNKLSEKETKNYLSLINDSFTNSRWSEDIIFVENDFPDALTTARIEWAGRLDDERLDHILTCQEIITDADALNISIALYHLKMPRFKQMAFYFCKNESFIYVWKDIFSLLAKVKDEDVENFFIEFLLNYDVEMPDIKKIVDDYFREY